MVVSQTRLTQAARQPPGDLPHFAHPPATRIAAIVRPHHILDPRIAFITPPVRIPAATRQIDGDGTRLAPWFFDDTPSTWAAKNPNKP